MTFVVVVVHVSWTSHLVPRTVAALYLPDVRNAPLPSPHSLRVFFLAAARLRLAALQSSGSLRVSTVTPPEVLTLNCPL